MDLGEQASHPLRVAELPRRVPEVELCEVPTKMLARDVVVRSVDGALELREEVLAGVGRDFASDVLTLGVIDRLMTGQLGLDPLVSDSRRRCEASSSPSRSSRR